MSRTTTDAVPIELANSSRHGKTVRFHMGAARRFNVDAYQAA
ncbi:hypothetical protein [Kibdelosporangium aridum]